jgi:transcriptional antiterminator RfaH
MPSTITSREPETGLAENPAAAWFCVRTQPKHEHIAAAHLRKDAGLEVYLPRIRFRRSTREGPVWFTEALFPGYLFGRFELAMCLRRVHHTRGVQGVVHFGDQWPTVPARAIEELRATVGGDQIHVIEDNLQPGEPVRISGGPFHDLRAVITRVMPGRERVALLIDFLGRQTAVELASDSVVREEDARQRAL